MKKHRFLPFVLSLGMLLTACHTNTQPAALHSENSGQASSLYGENSFSYAASSTQIEHTNTSTEGDSMDTITVRIDNHSFTAVLEDNPATAALLKQLPLTAEMKDLHKNEKYYYLPTPLPDNPQTVGSIRCGDLMLFGSDCLVLFYDDFPTSYQYTKLGCIENASRLPEALGSGNVTVTFTTGDE